MRKLKKQKGLTLMALIITIIVMLILVGVSVTLSLNGGLFNAAEQAVNETQMASERKELMSSVYETLDSNGKVNFTKLDKNLPQGFTGENGTYTTETGNRYIVNEDGIITLE